MATGSRILAGLAGTALVIGLAAAPAQASPLTFTTSFSAWTAGVAASSIGETALLPTNQLPSTQTGCTNAAFACNFTTPGSTRQYDFVNPTTPIGTTKGSTVAGLSGSWLGTSGNGVQGTAISIAMDTSVFRPGFGFYIEGQTASLTYTVQTYSDYGVTPLSSFAFTPGVSDSFVGFYGNDKGTPIVELTISAANAAGNPRTFEAGDFFAAAAPEPASMAMLGVGLLGLGMARRRKNRG